MSTSTIFGVTGMTCEHCVKAVTSELSALAGVTQVDVELHTGDVTRVTVISAHPLERADVEAAIDEAGYQMVPWDDTPGPENPIVSAPTP